MITNRLAKADPRLSDLIPESKSAEGFAGPAFSQNRPSASDIDVLVVLNRDQLPERYERVPSWRVASGMYTLRIRENQFDDLLGCPEVETVYGPQLMRVTLDSSMKPLKVDALARGDKTLSRTGKNVVVGIVDYGFDLTHTDFRNDDGSTRVAFFWDQSQKGKANPEGFDYGVEYDAKAIDAAINDGSRDRAFEILGHRPEEGAHGTLVAGIAAGNGRASKKQYVGAASDAILIFVNLAADPERGLVAQQMVYQAVEYIFSKAENAFEEPPDFNQSRGFFPFVSRKPRKKKKACVVNLSLSRNDGGHDGYSPFEQVIDRLLGATAGRAVVVAAGNAGDQRLHAEWRYGPSASTDLEWIIPAAEQQQSGSYDLELWYSSRDHISVQLISPEGEKSALIAPGMKNDMSFSGTSTLIESMRFLKPGCDARIFMRLRQPAMPGKWIIRLTASADSREGLLHGWIDDTPEEQSRATFGNAVSNRCTLGSPATAHYCISVGNIDHRSSPMAVVDSSGRGPTRDGREKPETVAPGKDITSSSALGGLSEAAGDPRPMHTLGSGTSMSAPHITGIVACLFQEHGGLSARQIQKVLIAAGTGDQYDEGEGYGIVDAGRALELVRNFVRAQ